LPPLKLTSIFVFIENSSFWKGSKSNPARKIIFLLNFWSFWWTSWSRVAKILVVFTWNWMSFLQLFSKIFLKHVISFMNRKSSCGCATHFFILFLVCNLESENWKKKLSKAKLHLNYIFWLSNHKINETRFLLKMKFLRTKKNVQKSNWRPDAISV
jgi:hypothetical protein